MTCYLQIPKYISLHFENTSNNSVHCTFRLPTGRASSDGQTKTEAAAEVYLLKFEICVVIIASSI